MFYLLSFLDFKKIIEGWVSGANFLSRVEIPSPKLVKEKPIDPAVGKILSNRQTVSMLLLYIKMMTSFN